MPGTREGEEDGTIMEKLVQMALEQEVLEKANLCRLHFKMLWVGDAYNIDGRLRTQESEPEETCSKLAWPKTPVPAAWKRWWWEQLREWFPESIKEVTWHARQTNASATPDGEKVLYKGEVFERIIGRTRRKEYRRRGSLEMGETVPCVAVEKRSGIVEVKIPRVKVVEIDERRIEKTTRLRWTEGQLQTVAHMLTRGTPCCASDASVQGNKKAVAVWIGSYQHGGVLLTEEVQGLPHDSGRAELAGPLLVMRVVKWLEERGKQLGHIDMWLDNKEVVVGCERNEVSRLPSAVCQRNMDMWLELMELKKECKAELTVRYVKAHQDDEEEYENLSFQGKLNVDCDKAAKRATKEIPEGTNTIDELRRGVEAMVWTEQGGLTVDPYAWFSEKVAKEVVKKRLKMTDRIFEMVDWQGHGRALGSIGERYRPSIQKMIWDESPTMEKLRRDGKEDSGRCPLCGRLDEAGHFLKCVKIQQEETVKVITGNLRAKLRARGVNPILSTWMLEVMSGKRPKKETLKPLGLHMRVSRVYDRQAAIGWENILNGRAAVGMEGLQDWWKEYKGTRGRKDHRASGETVKRALAYGMLYKYEVWKDRSRMIVDRVLPTTKRGLMRRVEEVKGRQMDVRAEDRNMFLERNIPGKEDSKETMREWLRGVKNSIERRERLEVEENRQIVDYLL